MYTLQNKKWSMMITNKKTLFQIKLKGKNANRLFKESIKKHW